MPRWNRARASAAGAIAIGVSTGFLTGDGGGTAVRVGAALAVSPGLGRRSTVGERLPARLAIPGYSSLISVVSGNERREVTRGCPKGQESDSACRFLRIRRFFQAFLTSAGSRPKALAAIEKDGSNSNTELVVIQPTKLIADSSRSALLTSATSTLDAGEITRTNSPMSLRSLGTAIFGDITNSSFSLVISL